MQIANTLRKTHCLPHNVKQIYNLFKKHTVEFLYQMQILIEMNKYLQLIAIYSHRVYIEIRINDWIQKILFMQLIIEYKRRHTREYVSIGWEQCSLNTLKFICEKFGTCVIIFRCTSSHLHIKIYAFFKFNSTPRKNLVHISIYNNVPKNNWMHLHIHSYISKFQKCIELLKWYEKAAQNNPGCY